MTTTQRIAMVVGAASGMGRQTALRLAREGFAVAVADVQIDRLATVSEEVTSCGARCHEVRIDVADGASVENGVRDVCSSLGVPWLLACTVGIVRGEGVLDLPDGIIAEVMRVNFEGVAHVNAAVAREMVAAGVGGRIVNWSSVNAVAGSAGGSTYAASKAAVEAFSKSLAVELGPHGITVNVIRPGSVDTPLLADVSDSEAAADVTRTPLGRWGTSAEIAGAVAFLASDDAAWITGTTLVIDGGMLAMAGRPSLEQHRARFSREDAARRRTGE